MPVRIKRLSDGKVHNVADIGPTNHVKSLKDRIKAQFPPSTPNGCRLIFNGKVMKSIHKLKHYNVAENSVIDMDDRKNWSSSSSSSQSED